MKKTNDTPLAGSPEAQLADVPFLSQRSSVAEKTIRKWGAEGFFPVVKISRRCVRFPLAECDAIIEARTIQAK